jgi:hypothetical protein
MHDETLTTKQAISYKTCTLCKKQKPTNLFYAKTLAKDGLHQWCKKCKNDKLNETHSKSSIAFVRRLYQMVVSKTRREKKNEITLGMNEFIEIWKEQYEKFGMKCPYSGIEMTFKKGHGKMFTNISVDRYDNDRPYQDGNIVFCCMVVNRMKQELHINDFWNICKNVAENNSINQLNIY